MTKEELIEAMKGFADDSLVQVLCGLDCRDPGGTYNIIKVWGDVIPGRITFQIDDD